MTIKDEVFPTVKVDARLMDDGTLWIKSDKLADIGRVIVEDGKTFCKQFYQDAQPEREWSELDKQLIDTLLRKIYELQGTSLSMDGVVAKKYYVNELYKILFGRGEKPKWMI